MIKGVAFSISASLLFGVLYYLSTHLAPLSGEGIYGFRMWVSLPFIIGALFLFKQTSEFMQFLQRLKQQPHLIGILLLTAFITGSQMWLFLYAPNNGYAIDVSIGYLLMPIAMSLVGRFLFKESLSLLKILSILIAAIGVSSTVIATGSFSWATLMVLTGYPIYFSLRKYYGMSHLSSFVCEIILMLPVASYFVLTADLDYVLHANPHFYAWLALLGIVSGTALIAYVTASSLVPINVLGLLSYIEPVTMLTASFLIGEVLSPSSYLLMACLILAIGVLILDGLCSLRKRQKIQNAINNEG